VKIDSSTQTYLPAGADWYDFWTGELHPGGRSARKDVSLDTLPLFIRAGSIVPMGPVLQYSGERPEAPYEIRVYPGADASFTLYEDDNETYAYERGQRASYSLSWNDRAQTLTIGERRGSFPGLVRARQLDVVVIGQRRDGQAKTAQRIRYEGRPIRISFAGSR
jgi:alpha-D-xyloside xylohydrolase